MTGKTVYVSGQLPIHCKTGEFPSDDIGEQTRQSLENIRAVLEEAGYGMERIVKTTVYLRHMEDFDPMNEVYKEFFTDPYPARVAFQAAKLPKGARIEIDAIAE